MMKTNSLGLYIHIPFCISKCPYCDFLSFTAFDSEAHDLYVKELLKEITEKGKELGEDYLVDSIFFGGGTPSLLKATHINMILEGVFSAFKFSHRKNWPGKGGGKIPEISLEGNPGTLTKDNLRSYRDFGINRLSLGIQSLDDTLLKFLGRVHNRAGALESYNLARRIGFENINLDLIFGIPGQRIEVWSETLREIIRLGPEHISIYSLSIEEGTSFDKLFREGKLIPSTIEEDRKMYRKGLEELEAAAYEAYEISNMAKAGYWSVHNLKYWSFDDYLGLGLGSHSFIKGQRLVNTDSLNSYLRGHWLKESHFNSAEDNISEYIFTGLRKRQGILYGDFQERFSMTFREYLGERESILEGFLAENFLLEDDDGLRLTLDGIDRSNMIMAELM